MRRLPFTLAIITAMPAAAQQVSDTTFNPRLAQPAYAEGRGPVVLIDEGHQNLHAAECRFRVPSITLPPRLGCSF